MPHVNHGGGTPTGTGPATPGGSAAVAGPAPDLRPGHLVRTAPPAAPAPGPRPAPAALPAADRLRLALPGLAHPLLAPGEWAQPLRRDAAVHWVVLDVDNGPGLRPDPHCLEAAGRLKNEGRRRAAHIPAAPPAALLLGRLDLAHGARTPRALLAQARRHHAWYRVDGFLLDRCPAGLDALPAVARLTTALRALSPGAPSHLVLGHGAPPHPGYAELAEQLVTFAGPWGSYRWSQAPQWTAELPPERFCHLVHSVPSTHLDEALRLARWQGAGTVLLTDRAPGPGQDPQEALGTGVFETLPGYWDALVSLTGQGVSE